MTPKQREALIRFNKRVLVLSNNGKSYRDEISGYVQFSKKMGEWLVSMGIAEKVSYLYSHKLVLTEFGSNLMHKTFPEIKESQARLIEAYDNCMNGGGDE